MADKEEAYPENVKGEYYVDNSCIVCGICVGEAPENFSFTEGDKHAYVQKQPETDEEQKACESALASCPVDAIGDDQKMG